MKRPFSFASCHLCLPVMATALALGFAAAAFAADEAPTGPIIELPKFVVTDTRDLPKPETWRYATIPGFEILTNASDRTTQRLINDFETFKMALGIVWQLPDKPGAPTSLILCGKGGKFDGFMPSGKDTADSARASVFLKNSTRTAIVIDMQASVLNVLATEADDPASGSDSSQISVDHNKQLYREYVHYLLSKSEPRLPAWFEEGMAQIVMAMRVEPTYIEFGKIEDPNTVSTQAAMVAQMNALTAADDPDGATIAGAPVDDRDFNAALQRKALVPLDKFFAMKYDSPEALNPLGNNRWAKQAYAFVHMCLYGEHGKYQKAFSQFLSRSTREPVTEAMFKECFKIPDWKGTVRAMSYKDMLLALKGYIDFTNYESKEYRAKKGERLPKPDPLVLRDATQSEVGRIKGEAFALAGHNDKARTELIAPYIRGEQDPQLLAALGLFDHAIGEDARARKFLEAAVSAKVARAEAYLELARFRYADAIAKLGKPDDKFTDVQVSGVMDPLLVGRRQPPPMGAAYELMADTWLRSPTTPKKDDVFVLVDGIRMFPGRLRLVYETAVLANAADLIDTAHSLAEHGIKYAPDATVKARFEQLNSSLPPVPPAPPSTAPKASGSNSATPVAK